MRYMRMAINSEAITLPLSHIYVEREAATYPLSVQLLRRYAARPHISIEHYGEVFHRARQHFQIQKRRPALILAVSRERRIYKSDERIESFANRRLYYSDQLRNCLFNCSYCFLQGMHSSAHWLLFVNEEDYHHDAQQMVKERGTCWLSISYLSDLLGFEQEMALCSRWIKVARREPRLTIEIRTKSDNIRSLLNVAPIPNVLFVWSLSPAHLVQRHEHGTASLPNRLWAAHALMRRGWRIALCFDPILLLEQWEEEYRILLEQTFRRLPPEHIEQVSFGSFRMHPAFLKRLRRVQPTSDIVHQHYPSRQGVAAPPAETLQFLGATMRRMLHNFLPAERIHFVHG